MEGHRPREKAQVLNRSWSTGHEYVPTCFSEGVATVAVGFTSHNSRVWKRLALFARKSRRRECWERVQCVLNRYRVEVDSSMTEYSR